MVNVTGGLGGFVADSRETLGDDVHFVAASGPVATHVAPTRPSGPPVLSAGHRAHSTHGSPLVAHVLLVHVVVEELLDEVHVREEHPAAAVALEVELVQRVPFRVVGLEELEVRLVLIADHLAAGEAAHGDDHGRESLSGRAALHLSRAYRARAMADGPAFRDA
eukprot:CAMPEP_0205998764 /NCGR_PEP_ID=MMETSP1464-20131121/427_1 /ASSEMBLY_ACC=CAM_ASM_001124 /TAXON_ID=119497 /ORGANISM="Exanthemachrysis gayraliae, Strain RCC1523" /LENGTH=163 /DNA_ID=CAMNT_0053371919 /DNA_START=178 /DNA_END=668 /DNA_ORIENTATION=+